MLRQIRRLAASAAPTSPGGVLHRQAELRRRPDALARLQRSDRCKALLFDDSLSPLVVPAGSGDVLEPALVPWPELQQALCPNLDRPVVYLGGDGDSEADCRYFAVAASPRLQAWAAETRGAAPPQSRLHLMAATRLAHLWGPARSLLAWHRYNRHCSACGGPTEVADAGHRLVCSNPVCLVNKHSSRDGSSIGSGSSIMDHPIAHPRLDPTAIVLVASATDGCCLLARKTAFPGRLLSCLAGFAEAGESLEDCARREVEEEVGVAVPAGGLDYVGSQAWPFPAQLMIGFQATVDGRPDIKLDTDELEFADWFTARQVADMLGKTSQWRIPPRAALANGLITRWLKSLT